MTRLTADTYAPSSEADRAVETALRNSIALTTYYNRQDRQPTVLSQKAWLEFLKLRRAQAVLFRCRTQNPQRAA